MKLISQDQIETLGRFKSRKFLTTSFYLDTKKRIKNTKGNHSGLKKSLSESQSSAPEDDHGQGKEGFPAQGPECYWKVL